MKRTFQILLVFLGLNQLFAQHYVRTKKNIGALGMYSLSPTVNSQNISSSSPFLQLGLCRQFGKYTIPEFGISIARPSAIGLNPSVTGIFTGVQFRKNLIKINERKHGAKCKAEVIEGFFTPEFRYNFDPLRTASQNQFSLRYGLSLYHIESGASKRARAWVTKIEVYHRNYLGATNANPHEFGIALRIQYFKTYDFLK